MRAAQAKGYIVGKWLLKTEPGTYSWDDLVRDKRTTWDGVTNAVALKNIRAMTKGNPVIIYHTGDERAAVGVAEVASDPYPDPKAGDAKIVVVDLKPKMKLAKPVSLADIKADPAFAGWDLIRIGRLSVVPVPDAMWKRLETLASGK
jgi:predicted RNA-binding protein with PUA-like domain